MYLPPFLTSQFFVYLSLFNVQSPEILSKENQSKCKVQCLNNDDRKMLNQPRPDTGDALYLIIVTIQLYKGILIYSTVTVTFCCTQEIPAVVTK